MPQEDLMLDKQEYDEMNGSAIMDDDNKSENQGRTGKKPRGSRFRGVSRNGNQWQVTVII